MEKLSTQLRKHFILMFFLLSAVTFFVITSVDDAFATESGGNAYPLGAEDFMSGAVPPPGVYFINYFLYYAADEFNDEHGDSLVPDFDLEAAVNTFRFIYVTKHKIFGGNWGMHLFVPVWNLELTHPPLGGSQARAGAGDLIIDPLILSWHSKNWHFATGVDFYIPTGRHDDHDFANISRNYFTFEPIFAFTYMSDSGYEVSSKFMYDFNTKNSDSGYLSGQEFHFDYTLGKKFGPLSVGVGGYYYKQITDDELNGEKVEPDGFKGQAIAAGPQIKYDWRNISLTLKYLTEFEVENRPEGNDLWFKFVYAF